jgi:hypothetical protein
MVRVPPLTRITRARCLGATAAVESAYYRRLTVRRGDQPGNTTGIGTGSGRAGAMVALVVALIGMVLGGLALGRSRRTGRSRPS